MGKLYVAFPFDAAVAAAKRFCPPVSKRQRTLSRFRAAALFCRGACALSRACTPNSVSNLYFRAVLLTYATRISLLNFAPHANGAVVRLPITIGQFYDRRATVFHLIDDKIFTDY